MPSLICKYTVFLCLCFLSFVRKLTGKFSAPKKLILLLYKSTTNVGSKKTFNTWQPSIRLCLLLLSSLYLVVYLYPLPFQGLYMWPWYAVLQKIFFVLLFTHLTYTLVMILEWLLLLLGQLIWFWNRIFAQKFVSQFVNHKFRNSNQSYFCLKY